MESVESSVEPTAVADSAATPHAAPAQQRTGGRRGRGRGPRAAAAAAAKSADVGGDETKAGDAAGSRPARLPRGRGRRSVKPAAEQTAAEAGVNPRNVSSPNVKRIPTPTMLAAEPVVDRRPFDTMSHGHGRSANRPRLTVAVDLDEVLGLLADPLAVWHNRIYGTTFTAESFNSYQFCNVWGGNDADAAEKVEEFFKAPEFLGMTPMKDAQDMLRKLLSTGRYRFVLVTSRQLVIEELTRKWIADHYEGIFDQVVFGNHYGRSGVKRSKPELCAELGADVLIDDRADYCVECSHTLRMSILFGDYAWNRLPADQEAHLPPNVIRAKSWKDVADLLSNLIIVSDRKPYTVYCGSIRKALSRHRNVEVVAAGAAVPIAVDAVERLSREGVIRITTTETGMSGHTPRISFWVTKAEAEKPTAH